VSEYVGGAESKGRMAALWACAVNYVIKGTFLRPGFWSGVLLGFEPSLANHYSMIGGMKFAKVRRPVMHIVHIEYRSIWLFLQCGVKNVCLCELMNGKSRRRHGIAVRKSLATIPASSDRIALSNCPLSIRQGMAKSFVCLKMRHVPGISDFVLAIILAGVFKLMAFPVHFGSILWCILEIQGSCHTFGHSLPQCNERMYARL